MISLQSLFKFIFLIPCFVVLLCSPEVLAQDLTPVARYLPDLFDVQWHPSKQIIAVGGQWGVKIYTDTLQELAHVPSQGGAVVSVSWNPNGQQLASAGSIGDGTIHIWNWNSSTNSLTLHTVLSNNHEREYFLAWSPDGTRIASIGADTSPNPTNRLLIGSVQIWNVTNWSLEKTFSLQPSPPVRSLSWSPDSTRIAFGGRCPAETTPCPNGVIIGIFIGDVMTGEITQAIDTNTGEREPNAVSWKLEKIAVSEWASVVTYDADTMERFRTFALDNFVNRVAVSPDGYKVAFSYDQASGGILDMDSGASFDFSMEYAYSGRITGLSWNSDGSHLASVTERGAIEIWGIP